MWLQQFRLKVKVDPEFVVDDREIEMENEIIHRINLREAPEQSAIVSNCSSDTASESDDT